MKVFSNLNDTMIYSNHSWYSSQRRDTAARFTVLCPPQKTV